MLQGQTRVHSLAVCREACAPGLFFRSCWEHITEPHRTAWISTPANRWIRHPQVNGFRGMNALLFGEPWRDCTPPESWEPSFSAIKHLSAQLILIFGRQH